MKIPRDLDGGALVKMLKKVGYEKVHQTGSHIIIRTEQNGADTQTVPNHKPLKVGTLDGILGDIAEHLGIDKSALLRKLTSRRSK